MTGKRLRDACNENTSIDLCTIAGNTSINTEVARDATALETDPEPKLIEAPPMRKRKFSSWDEFNKYVEEYATNSWQIYTVRSGTPSETRNARIPATSRAPRIPVKEFAHYSKALQCTFGGKPRSRSTGARRNQKARSLLCPAMINACVRYENDEWCVCVTNHNRMHNHPINVEAFKSLPRVRNAIPRSVMIEVKNMIATNEPRRSIWKHIQTNADNLKAFTMKDTHNLISRMKKQSEIMDKMTTTLSEIASVLGSREFSESVTFLEKTMRLLENGHRPVLAVDPDDLKLGPLSLSLSQRAHQEDIDNKGKQKSTVELSMLHSPTMTSVRSMPLVAPHSTVMPIGNAAIIQPNAPHHLMVTSERHLYALSEVAFINRQQFPSQGPTGSLGEVSLSSFKPAHLSAATSNERIVGAHNV